jgi:sarcosine oxidase, subunit gamma
MGKSPSDAVSVRSAMPDPMAKWSPTLNWRTASLTRRDWSAKPAHDLCLILIGGQIERALAALAPQAELVGLWQVASGDDQAIRIGRDKALLVLRAAPVFDIGWNPQGWSVTPAESAFGVIDIEGLALREIVSEATAADLNAVSRSASTLFAGVPCLVTRKSPEVARVFVEAGYAPYLWRWLETRL